MKAIVLTGSDLRHSFFRMALALADGVEVVSSYCETTNENILRVIDKENPESELQYDHLARRQRSEEDFFLPFVRLAEDKSAPRNIAYGEINSDKVIGEITAAAPDLLVAYGCSLIKPPLIDKFSKRFLNVHLGLSPYYRGSGTNFWPLVNGEPEFVGATFMHIDAGVDTGEIIHQIRARCFPGDTPHQIGNRLISDMTSVYIDILHNIKRLEPLPQPNKEGDFKYYRRSDFSVAAVKRLYENFSSGMIERYVSSENSRIAKAPLLSSPLLQG